MSNHFVSVYIHNRFKSVQFWRPVVHPNFNSTQCKAHRSLERQSVWLNTSQEHLTPETWHLTLDTWLLTLDTLCLTIATYLTISAWQFMLDICHWTLGIWHLTLDTWQLMLDNKDARSVKFRVFLSVFLIVSDTGLNGSEMQNCLKWPCILGPGGDSVIVARRWLYGFNLSTYQLSNMLTKWKEPKLLPTKWNWLKIVFPIQYIDLLKIRGGGCNYNYPNPIKDGGRSVTLFCYPAYFGVGNGY